MTKKQDAVPLYRRIINDAWRIAWENKQLWLFGFFVTFIGFGGVSEVFFKAYDKDQSGDVTAEEISNMRERKLSRREIRKLEDAIEELNTDENEKALNLDEFIRYLEWRRGGSESR